MALFRISAPVQALNPARIATWSASFRAGDDLKIAFTLLDVDCETPIDVTNSNSSLVLFENTNGRFQWDYGNWWTSPIAAFAAASVEGTVFASQAGRINFFLPAAQTSGLCSAQYRMLISVDQPDGVSTQMDGTLQVLAQAPNALGNAGRNYMQTGLGLTGVSLLPPLVNAQGQATDIDGFPLSAISLPPVTAPGTSAVLGVAVLGRMVLGSSV